MGPGKNNRYCCGTDNTSLLRDTAVHPLLEIADFMENIETNNPAWKLENIEIRGYGAMSDIAIYNLDYDKEYQRNWNTDNCVQIVYFRKVFEWW